MIIRIAIIEDEQPYIDYLRKLINKWCDQNEVTPIYYEYLSGDSFFWDWESISFDMIFIDILFPNKDLTGIEIASRIRITDNTTIIVFVTNIIEEISKGYDVSALQYLIKPAKYTDIEKCMDKAKITLMERKSNSYAFQKNKNCLLRIPYNDIIAFSSALQYTEIITKKTSYRQLERLKNIEKCLPNNFERCHRSIIINIEEIALLTHTDVTMTNRAVFPVSKTCFEKLKEKFINFFNY